MSPAPAVELGAVASARFVPSVRAFAAVRCFVLGCGVLLASAAFAAEENKILFPSSGSTPVAPAGGGVGNATLIVGLMLAAVGGWFVWRGRQANPRAADGRALAIEETRSLGNRQYLVVASYEGKKFLLGVCPGRIEHLAALPSEPHDE